jgi:hypothetical protein
MPKIMLTHAEEIGKAMTSNRYDELDKHVQYEVDLLVNSLASLKGSDSYELGMRLRATRELIMDEWRKQNG